MTYKIILENCAFPSDGSYVLAKGLSQKEAWEMVNKMEEFIELPTGSGSVEKYRPCIDVDGKEERWSEYDDDDEEE